uniref:asparagine synthase-related protein n=1 Tax=Pseudonocardia sp. CA-138482 TaxID=3240023 RepID=UPI003F496EC3
MSSVALAVTPGQATARSAVEAMAAGLEDRSAVWEAAGGTSIAVGAGAGDRLSAAQMIVTRAAVTLAVDAPAWVRRQLAPVLTNLAELGEVTSPAPVVDVMSSLRGDAHLVAVIESRGAVAYRGAMSSRPLFYAPGPDRSLLVASQIRGIRAARPAEVSLPGLAPFLVPQLCDPTGTTWTGIHRLPPGHALIWWDGELHTRQVSRVDPLDPLGAASASRDELVTEFRRRLLRAIARASNPPDGILLSGGIDSSSLACAYAALGGCSARGYALTYGQELAACDERRYVDDVEHATGMAVSRLPGNRLLPLVADFPEADEPEPWAYAARNWGLLRHIAADPEQATATVLAGEGGDELLLGQVFAVVDRFARGDIDGASGELRTFPDPAGIEQVVKGLLHGDYDREGARVLRALGEVPPWLGADYVSETGIVDRLAAGYPRLGEPGLMAVNYSRGVLGEMGAAGRVQCGGWWEDMGRKAGITITYPFLDPDLAALVWALPPELLRDGGLEKVVLREALSDVLPASVARRPDKAEALALMHAGLRVRIETVREVTRGGPLADHGVIHPGKLASCIERYLAGDLGLAPALWATTAVNRWLIGPSPAHVEGPRP